MNIDITKDHPPHPRRQRPTTTGDTFDQDIVMFKCIDTNKTRMLKPTSTGGFLAVPNTGSKRNQFDQDESMPVASLIEQPETRPIYQEQLDTEVTDIDAESAMVGRELSEVDFPVPLEYHDFSLAPQDPSPPTLLERLASKYTMPAGMWRHVLEFTLLYLVTSLTMTLISEMLPAVVKHNTNHINDVIPHLAKILCFIKLAGGHWVSEGLKIGDMVLFSHISYRCEMALVCQSRYQTSPVQGPGDTSKPPAGRKQRKILPSFRDKPVRKLGLLASLGQSDRGQFCYRGICYFYNNAYRWMQTPLSRQEHTCSVRNEIHDTYASLPRVCRTSTDRGDAEKMPSAAIILMDDIIAASQVLPPRGLHQVYSITTKSWSEATRNRNLHPLHLLLSFLILLPVALATDPTLSLADPWRIPKVLTLGVSAMTSFGTGLASLQLDMAAGGDPAKPTQPPATGAGMGLRVASSATLGFVAVFYPLWFLQTSHHHSRKARRFLEGACITAAACWLCVRLVGSSASAVDTLNYSEERGVVSSSNNSGGGREFLWLDELNFFLLVAVVAGILNAERGLFSSAIGTQDQGLGRSERAGMLARRGAGTSRSERDEEEVVLDREQRDGHQDEDGLLNSGGSGNSRDSDHGAGGRTPPPDRRHAADDQEDESGRSSGGAVAEVVMSIASQAVGLT